MNTSFDPTTATHNAPHPTWGTRMVRELELFLTSALTRNIAPAGGMWWPVRYNAPDARAMNQKTPETAVTTR